MSKYHNTYQRIYQEKYIFLDTVTQPHHVIVSNRKNKLVLNIANQLHSESKSDTQVR